MNTSIYSLLQMFDEHKIPYEIYSLKDNSITVQVAVPGEIWKFEFPQSGQMNLEIFKSTGEIQGLEKLCELAKQFSLTIDNSIYSLTNELRRKNIGFFISQEREEPIAIMVTIMIPDEHWEIEFFESEVAGDGGAVQIEIFKSSGKTFGEEKIDELVRIFTE